MIEEFREWTPAELGERIVAGPGEVVAIRVVDENGSPLIRDLTVIGIDVGQDFDRSGGYAWTEIVAKQEPPARPVGQPPWREETVAVPGRIDGWRVVAAARLPQEPNQPVHRYVAVVEAMPGPGFQVCYPVHWWPKKGFEALGRGPLVAHHEAMARFTQIIAGII